jgi:tRNA (guanine-N7-)-methyltransferase
MATCILTPASITEPLPVDAIFASGAPLEVDVGAGKGRFLLARASANPDVCYLAIERLLGRVRKIDSKLTRNGLANVRIIRLEAFYALQFLLPPKRIRTVYIHFPDPWPKRRHHKRRLFSPEFLDILHDRLEPGGTVQIATDHLDYFEAIRKAFARDTRYREAAPIPRKPEEQTDFELIFRGQGKPIGECAYLV